VRTAVEAGQRVFGENRVQDALDKMQEVAGDLEWHLVGHIQSNKAKRTPAFACIHAVDSVELMSRLDAAAGEAGRRPRVLVQVDLADEPTKYGAPIDAVAQVVAAGLACQSAQLSGLMAIPPRPTNPEDSRQWFKRLKDLRDQLVRNGVPADSLRELSMGMSHDFEVAIEEGATMVRVGTAIFGTRTAAPRP
jgi:pyridoxal phosphate enzyme (YggS family)